MQPYSIFMIMDVRKYVTDLVFRTLDRRRGINSPNVFASLVPLYAFRYNLRIRFESSNEKISLNLIDSEDELFGYINHLGIGGITQSSLSEIINGLSQIDKDVYDEAYPLIVDDIIARFELNAGKSMSIMGQPAELTELVSRLIIREGCRNIYNPFAGLASYATRLNGICHYHGQELNMATAVLAQIRLKAHGIDIHNIESGDSIQNWNPGDADCIVATPPFGLRLQNEQHEGLAANHSNAESFCVDAALHSNASTAIFVTSNSFGFKTFGSNFAMRKTLSENKTRLKVKYVIDLPDNIFTSTSLPSKVLVLSVNASENPLFIDATECFIKNRFKNVLNVDDIIGLIDGKPADQVVSIDQATLFKNNCSFSTKLYLKKPVELKDGEKLVGMNAIFEPVKDRSVKETEGIVIDSSLFSDVWFDCMDNKNQAKHGTLERAAYAIKEPCIVLTLLDETFKVYIHDSSEQLLLRSNQCALRVIDSSISLDYAALILLNGRNSIRYPFERRFLDFNGMAAMCDSQSLIILDDVQARKTLMHTIMQETFAKRRNEEEARQRRLGISQLSSDISHMLGTTMSNSQDIIADIHDMAVSDNGYEAKVQALIDCINKTFRVIKYSGANLADNEFSIEEFSIHEYLNDYIRAWRSYGSKCFALDIINEVSIDTIVNADRTMLDIQLDTILDNAKKHGFGSKKKPGNQVLIEVSAASYKEKKYVLLRVSNNGKPMRSDMTMEDFISASRYRVDSGRLSQGGNHIYTIAKKNGGYFFLGRDQEDKMYIDILIPAVYPDKETIYEYDRECI